MSVEQIAIARKIANKALTRKNIVTKKSASFRYAKYRVLRPILKVITKLQNSRYSPSPWLSPTSIRIFDKILSTEMTGLEYGSGSSTLFFGPRLKKLVSIEHHQGWYEKVLLMLDEAKLGHVELLLIPESEEAERGTFNKLGDGFEARDSYSTYFNRVNDFPDEYFDFALIDGRARVECTFNALPKIKRGGILALDNSERERYQPIFEKLKDWECVQTTNGLTNTTLWFKP